MSTEDTIKYPRFIKNSPIGEDQFEGQSQHTIAKSIAELLESNSCQMIGVDGGWGTGKSNLVLIVESLLSEKGFYFFTYDAWGHQEDIQRRAILEELTDNLTRNNANFDSKKWKDKLKSLLAKNKETNTTAKPSISLGIILSALAIVLTPILKIVTENICNTYLKAGIVSIPLIILLSLLFFYYRRSPKHNSKQLKISSKERFTFALQKLFEIYQKDKIVKTTNETISEEEPSVAKFREWMNDIDIDLNKNKLILVFDNMDRLPKIKVQELWSSIHAFFADREYDNIKVIVPFDRKHIRTAFSENGGSDCYGDDFINKSFSVIFRVSPPILSNWKNYFSKKWIEAFGESDIELKRVVQIYDALNERLTPREIIAFINEFVSIKKLTNNTIPNRYIALFILGKNAILENPLKEIITPSYLKGLSFIYEKDSKMQEYITSLAYQIPVENSLQVVYTKRLKDALDNKDVETVKLISKSNDFEHILTSIIPDLSNIDNSIIALKSVNSESFENVDVETDIWDNLYRKSLDNLPIGQKLHEFQTILLDKISLKKELISVIISEFIDSQSNFNAIDYFTSINQLQSRCKEYELDVFSFLKQKMTNSEEFVKFIKVAKEDYKKYKIECLETDVDKYLSERKIEDYKNLEFVKFIKDDYRITQYQNKIKEFFGAYANQIDNFKVLVQRYNEVNSLFKVDIADANIYTHFTNLSPSDEFYFDLIAMRLAKGNNFHSSYAPSFNSILNSESDAIVSGLAKVIGSYVTYGEFMTNVDFLKIYPLYRNVAKKLTIEYRNAAQVANTPPIMKKLEEIVNASTIDPKDILLNLSRWKVSQFKSDKFKQDVPVYALKEILKLDNHLTKHMKKIGLEYLDDLREENWDSIFANANAYEIDIALLLNYKWNTSSLNALKKTLKLVAIGDTAIPSKSRWNKIINSIEKSGRRLVAAFNDIRDMFISNCNMSTEYFLFFGDWLFKYSSLAKKQESLRTILPTLLLNNQDCLNIIIDNKEMLPDIISKAGIDESSDFKDALLECIDNVDDNTLKDLVAFLGWEEPKTEDNKNDKE